MFQMRTSCPGGYDKNYMTTSAGGFSTCIKGNPNKADANVLANCVGYAQGRFNEIINKARGTSKNNVPTFNCNAENFVERAISAGFKTGSTPRRGAICCLQKGNTLSGNDGAGHVFIVEEVYDNNHIYTSESGYNSSYFWNAHRYNNNGRWGSGNAYTFRAFIYLPEDVQKIIDEQPKPEPTPADKFNIGDKVVVNGPLYISSNATNANGSVSNKITNITRKVKGSAHPYNTTGDLGWMDESSITAYVEPTPTPQPKPEPISLKAGDKVKITKTGNANSLGTGKKAYGIGWTRRILRVYEGRAYPYQVGDNTGTTGFYKADALQKL